MDIPRLAAMNSHWAGSPPVHIMLAQFFGYNKPKPKPAATSDENSEMAELLGMLSHVQ